MAQLTYGSYAFLPDSTWFTINRQAVIGDTGRRNLMHHQWVINGRVQGANSTAVTTAIAALEAAMVDGYDLKFSLGGHQLLSSDCMEGTHIRRFTWLPGYDGVRGSGAENVLRRTYQIVIDGMIKQTSDTDIIAWSQSLIGIGNGGADVVPVGSLSGTVQAQTVQSNTPYFAIQSGFAIGLTASPSQATPMFTDGGPVYWMRKRFRSGIYTPQRFGVNYNTRFKVDWSYQFWSASAISGVPSLW